MVVLKYNRIYKAGLFNNNKKNKKGKIKMGFQEADFKQMLKIKKVGKNKGLKTFGELKKYINKEFKKRYGIEFIPSILMLCCNDYKEYKRLKND